MRWPVSIAVFALIGCSGEALERERGDLTFEAIEAVAAMDCVQLAMTEDLLRLIDDVGPELPALVAALPMTDDNRATAELLLEQSDTGRNLVGTEVNLLQLIRFCPS